MRRYIPAYYFPLFREKQFYLPGLKYRLFLKDISTIEEGTINLP
jgi:hypothetical protein